LKSVDHARLKNAALEILTAIGEDVGRDGLKDTPRRFADAWREFIEYDPGRVNTSFTTVESDQMVVVSGMEVWSLCEHHLLPFRCKVAVAYIPDGKLLGLSKLGRIAQEAAHRLQVQERLVAQIAGRIKELAETDDVAVFAEGEHLCMTMRGVRTPATMATSVIWGRFRSSPEARSEFLGLVRR
jgi:GTP cyclohydrolase IA